MIKMVGTAKSGRKLILLALSEGNLMRLREKKPIHINGEELNTPGMPDIIICWGPTEEALAKELSDLIGPDTVVRDHRGGEKN